MWNAEEIEDVHEKVKRKYGFEEPDLDVKISLY
jgi:hypothetical protein